MKNLLAKLILCTILLSFQFKLIAQSHPVFSVSPSQINSIIRHCGDSTQVSVTVYNNGNGNLTWKGFSQQEVFDDFDSGFNPMWTILGGTISSSCGTNSGFGAMYFNSSSSRYIQSQPQQVNGGSIDFYLKIGTGSSPCENADGGEEVVLEYSVNGVTWTTMNTYNTSLYSSFTQITEAIPAAANSSTTSFRWRQLSHSGSGYDNWAIDDVSITNTGSQFIGNLSPDSSFVLPSDSVTVQIMLNSDNLNSGQYRDVLYFQTNDPLNPIDSVIINLTLVGTAQYQLSAGCLNFPTIQENDTRLDSIEIVNTGCDTLQINSVTSNLTAFVPLTTTLDVLPEDTGHVLVQFAPVSIGNFNGTLSITSNTTAQTKCLNASAVGAPSMSFHPSSISDTLYGCDDSLIIPIQFYNTGNGPLHLGLRNYLNYSSVTSPGTYIFDGFESGNTNTWNQINTGATVNVVSQNPATGSRCLSLLGSGDLLQRTFTPDTVKYISVKMRTDDLGYSNYFIIGDAFSTYALAYIRKSGTSQYQVVGNYSYVHNFSNASNWTHFEFKNIDYINKTFDLYIDGIFVSSTLDFYSFGTQNVGRITLAHFDNVLPAYYDDIQIGNKTIPNWAFLSPDTVNINQNDSAIVFLKLKSTDLVNGTYRSRIDLINNDPLRNPDSIPVSFVVSGYPEIAFDTSCLAFPTIQENTAIRDSILLYNTGCEDLNISSITSSHGAFVLDTSNYIIPAYDSAYIGVSFAPSTFGTFNAQISILNNNRDTLLCISGTAIGAPVINHSPLSIVQTISSCDDSIVVPVTIYNTGNGTLHSSVQSYLVSTGSSSYFFDGFEQGNWNNWTTINTSAFPVITTQNPASGNRALSLLGSGDLLQYNFTPDTLDYISVKMRTDDNGYSNYFIVGSATSMYGMAYIRKSGNSQYQVRGNLNYYHTVRNNNNNNWTHFEFRNIDYVNKTFDLYIDGVMASSTLGFYNTSTTSVGIITLSHFDNVLPAYYDDIQLGQRRIPDFVNPSVDTLNVLSSDSAIINVTLYSRGLENGLYGSEVFFLSNDPTNPRDSIPVWLTVSGTPEISLSQACLNYPSTVQHRTSTDSLWVINEGCDSLRISNMISSSSHFATSFVQHVIAPFDSVLLYVDFTPSTVGSFTDSIRIVNNDRAIYLCLQGQSTQAPIISYTPRVYSDTIASCFDSLIFPIKVKNTGGGVLNAQFVNQGQQNLDTILNKILRNHTAITAHVPTLYSFTDGFTGTNIVDGGGDMYDGGNYLNTNFVNAIPYTNNTVQTNVAFGPSGEYFTCKVNGLFVMVADLDNVSDFSITGNLGADGSGQVAASTISTSVNGVNYIGFVKSVYAAGDPSINHLIIVEQSVGATRTHLTTTGNENHVVSNINTANRIYYLLYSDGYNSSTLTNSVHLNVMNSFLSNINGSSDFELKFNPNTVNVNSGDSTVVNATVVVRNLTSGSYTAKGIVLSNDPLNSIDSLLVNIHVNASPEIGFGANCINFGNQHINSSTTDSLLTYNSGCDTLRISTVVSFSPNYQFGQTSYILAPGDSAYIKVTYNPTTLGNHNSFMRVFNNAVDSTICLTAASVPAPVAVLNPTSITASVNLCDSADVTVNLSNLGGSMLRYNFAGGRQSSSGTLEVLSITYGADMSREYPNMITGINQYFTNYNLTAFNTLDINGNLDSNLFKTQLQGKDVVLIPEIESGNNIAFFNIYPALRNFVNTGGTVLFFGTSSRADVIFNSGLFSGSYNNYNNSAILTKNFPSHPILTGTTTPIVGISATLYYNILNTDTVTILTYNNYPVITARNQGLGKVALIGFDYYNRNTNIDKIAANALQWAGASGRIPSWISIDRMEDSIPASGGHTITFTFDASQLSAGQHIVDVVLNTNDPLNPTITIPCTLNVINTPCAKFDYTKTGNCSRTVQFNDSSTNNPTNWYWDFGDGSSSTLRSPSHIYSSAGVYSVMLIASNGLYSDTTYRNINITSMVGSFVTTSPLVAGQLINFVSTAVGATSYYWNFGNGQFSSQANPSTIYATAGQYIVSLITVNNVGCSHVFTDTLNIILTGLEGSDLSKSLYVSPNPSDGLFSITNTSMQFIKSVRVRDAGGRLVEDVRYNETEAIIDLLHVTPGIYHLIIEFEDANPVFKKLIVK